MKDESDSPDKLVLAGYVPIFPSGFALPCYAANSRANIWYVATCSVDGDHSGTITGFEIFDPAGLQLLPNELHLEVSAEEPWRDVFLWAGVPHVGVPDAILQELNSEFTNIAAEIPISLLDLVLSTDSSDARLRLSGSQINLWA